MSLLTRLQSRKYSLLGLLLAAAVVLAAIGPFSGYSSRAYKKVKRQWLILTGGLIDVGGYYLRVECRGSGRTVIFESGLSQPRDTWGAVPGEIAKTARVCTYDRAGVGESDRAGFIRTSSDVVRELRELLKEAGETGPFIVVGHSFGGLNARLYAIRYPQEVSGLVLVEPSHEDQYMKIAELKPASEREQYLRHEGGDNGEDVDLLASSGELRSLAGEPLPQTILLTANDNARSPLNSVSLELNTLFARSNPSIEHIPIENCGHFPQLDRPDVVIASIRKLLQ